MKKLQIIVLLFSVSILSCKKDMIDFEKISKKVEFDRELAVPLVHGSFNLSKFIEQNEDSIISVENDTVKLFIREDSLFNFEVSDVLEFPEQGAAPYVILSPITISITDSAETGEYWSPLFLVNDTIFDYSLTNSMRIDSMKMRGGEINVTVWNNFPQQVNLLMRSVDVTNSDDNYLLTTIPVNGNSTASQRIPLNDHTIKTRKGPTGESQLTLSFVPSIYNNGVDTVIYTGNNLLMMFSIEDREDFEIAYGFAGYHNYSYDTSLVPDWESIEGLSGTFNVTNPKIKFIYQQSFGFNVGADISLHAFHSTQPDVIINPETFHISKVESEFAPPVNGVLEISSANVSNIDEIIAFPIPDSLNISAFVETNPGSDSLTEENFVLHNSSLDVDLEIEIPLEFRADLTYRDTMEIGDLGDLENTTVDYANLHYWFENYFPIGFNAQLILYDSISMQNVDTIYLTDDPNEYFLEPAPVDAQGLVIMSQVEKYSDFVPLSSEQIDNLIKNSTHIIILAKLQSTNIASVKILQNYSIEFQLGLEAEGTYSGYMNEN